MRDVLLRQMNDAEYEGWVETVARLLANEQVAAGNWHAAGSVELAREAIVRQLPQGVDTPRMLILHATDAAGEAVGHAWVSLDHPRGLPDVAFLQDIEVVEQRRGSGWGRALLGAVEEAVRAAGAPALELNVFAHNAIAVGLYDTSGYHVVTQQMRKAL